MAAADYNELRSGIIEVCRKTLTLGLNQGTSGNASARAGEGFLITPSGVPYDQMEPAQVSLVGFDGNCTGDYEPSSEWRLHAAILAARPEAGAVIHTHAPFSTALSCLGKGIPAFHYMVAVAGGGDIRCAAYATFGTGDLAANAVAALDGRRACLLANHGMICFGADPGRALDLAVEVEALAAAYWRTLQIGEPVLLADDEMTRVLERFRSYGQGPRDGG